MPQLPNSDNRTAVVGSTGGGKTQFAAWLLSTRDFHIRPWVIFDFKRDKLIAEIEKLGALEISIFGAPPTKPGIYIVRPMPERDDAAVEKFLWKVLDNEETGLWFDEGYMINRNSVALKALLTQGRSKHIEMITLSQRPVFVSRFVFTEASYFAIFNLTVKDDRDSVRGYLGDGVKINLLPKYHCTWYDVDKQEPCQFDPVPDRKAILSTFEARLKKRKPRLV